MAEPRSAPKGGAASALRTVLLVDDVDDCRVTTKWFLTNFGYAVESARSAEEALALFDPKTHDVVVTDNSMPGMTGAEMAHIIKLRSPATLVVMYTGLPPNDQSCLDLVIQRPAHLLTLKEALDKLIAARGSSSSSEPPVPVPVAEPMAKAAATPSRGLKSPSQPAKPKK
jgi:CheY-like chemotaxis protein